MLDCYHVCTNYVCDATAAHGVGYEPGWNESARVRVMSASSATPAAATAANANANVGRACANGVRCGEAQSSSINDGWNWFEFERARTCTGAQ
jgi:hypothetical protein